MPFLIALIVAILIVYFVGFQAIINTIVVLAAIAFFFKRFILL